MTTRWVIDVLQLLPTAVLFYESVNTSILASFGLTLILPATNFRVLSSIIPLRALQSPVCTLFSYVLMQTQFFFCVHCVQRGVI